MILILDITNLRSRIGLADPDSILWKTAAGRGGYFRILARLLKILKKYPRVTCIAAALTDQEHWSRRDVSWSTVRSAVAVGNALAFAWRIPTAEIRLDGRESPRQIAELAHEAAAASRPGTFVRASYSGEPNITMVK